MTKAHLLVVDDTPDDVYFLIRTIRKTRITNEIQVCDDGRSAIQQLGDRSKPLPLLVFCDLKMPSINGFELLAWRNEQPELKDLPIVITSGSDLPEDIRRATDLGAHAYFTKPLLGEDVEMVVKAYASSITRSTS